MIYLVIVIALLCGLLAFELYLSRQERNKLLNAIISKTPEQLMALEANDKVKAVKQVVQNNLVSEDSLSEDELKAFIEKGVV